MKDALDSSSARLENLLSNRGTMPVIPTMDAPVLNSWKDIAEYLGRGVRTVQRWERELGLPVRRPRNHLRSPVVAIPSELDEWLRRGLTAQSTAMTSKREDGLLLAENKDLVATSWVELAAALRENLEVQRTLRSRHRVLIQQLSETKKQVLQNYRARTAAQFINSGKPHQISI
jgi:hypothetical protein